MNENQNIRSNRLTKKEYQKNFCDIHPKLNLEKAAIESNRCYFCHDAPCIRACPTEINIPGFIHKISTKNTRGAALEILKSNIMGATCARVCPVEELCQEACVRNINEDKPVEIGLLQRYAIDVLFKLNIQPFKRKPNTGKRIAIVGAGPAGLSAAHGLAMNGHEVTIFEAKEKSGGLNEYGLAAYKVTDQITKKEIDFILEIGGIKILHGKKLGTDITLDQLRDDFNAVFLGIGLRGVNSLRIENEDMPGVLNAVDSISEIRQAENINQIPIGKDVVVIGGGNTAIDIAIQIKRLGAETVTLAYRRGENQIGATKYEQELAQKNDVFIRKWAKPVSINGSKNRVESVEFEKTTLDENEKLIGTGEKFIIKADVVYKAIGQTFIPTPLENNRERPEFIQGKISVNENRKTSLPNVYAGGDCVPGSDLTVTAVQDGKIAAQNIHLDLIGQGRD